MAVPRRLLVAAFLLVPVMLAGQRTQKPALHGRHWVAITGKPLAATAGAMMFAKGGNPVDAACAMLAAVTTMWDVLSWGGETQALIYNPRTKKVIAINALGVAPTGATPDFYRAKGMQFPPEYGPLAAITPGTPGGLMTILAEYGTLSLRDVLEPAIRMADGYPIEEETANSIERNKRWLKQWRYSRAVMLPHLGEAREAPEAGEIFRQPDLAATLRKLVDAERRALGQGKNRRDAIYAAYDRFYKGDIAQEFVRGFHEEGGLITLQDLASWKVKIEEPVMTTYRGIDVYKLQPWSQGPAMLQALNILETFDHQGDGLQQHTLHPHVVPGDEPRVCRSRFLLRRPGIPARRTDPRAALEGIRAAAGAADQSRTQRSGDQAGRSLSLPGWDESIPQAPARLASRSPSAAAGDIRRRDAHGAVGVR